MDVKANDIEAIVRQVLSSLKDSGNAPSGAAPAPKKTAGGVPATAAIARTSVNILVYALILFFPSSPCFDNLSSDGIATVKS